MKRHQNKQPFYHRVELIFMSTTGFGEKDFLDALANALGAKKLGVDLDSIVLEAYLDPEPGDPADLL